LKFVIHAVYRNVTNGEAGDTYSTYLEIENLCNEHCTEKQT